jgi:membrane protease YdiL (CAAX protease family)
MPMNRFWSSFWTVAGFLLLLGWLQRLVDTVVTLFGILDKISTQASSLVLFLSWAVVPAWGALKFVDWRWGWKPDNAGLRTTPAAAFWLIPGLLAGGLAVALVYLIGGGSISPSLGRFPSVADAVVILALVAAGAFASEVVYRGVLISRFQQDLSGMQMLLLAIGMPFVWTFAQHAIGRVLFINPVPSTGILGLGTAVMSVFLSLLFLRTDSVWLTAGMRIPVALMGTGIMGEIRPPMVDQGLLIVFGIPAVILLLMELDKMGTFRRPGGGPRRGPQRVVHGKTVRGPWGPH